MQITSTGQTPDFAEHTTKRALLKAVKDYVVDDVLAKLQWVPSSDGDTFSAEFSAMPGMTTKSRINLTGETLETNPRLIRHWVTDAIAWDKVWLHVQSKRTLYYTVTVTKADHRCKH